MACRILYFTQQETGKGMKCLVSGHKRRGQFRRYQDRGGKRPDLTRRLRALKTCAQK
ncbi:hypothetical protein AcetOrient_orf02958 [Acetobacter orientalis]|uniref:Uncharacterized protein n=1 Tax=Acetobacter orientalis TaxID=146474 RepID=A0A2Z5ZHU8_9PROT|nr:hypothetical protein AcetOrient_orf02958 [Acetobacter orientalis]